MTKDFSALMLLQGALIAVVVMTAFYIGLQVNAATASTMAFATLTLARLFHGFNCRSKHSIFKIGLASNVYSLLAFAAGVGLLAFVILYRLCIRCLRLRNLQAHKSDLLLCLLLFRL